MRDAEGLLVGACAHVQQVHLRGQLLGDAHALVKAISASAELRAADAQLDGKARANCRAYALEHLVRKAAAPLQAAAVGIRAVVEERGEELVDEPAVATMDHDHLEACTLCEPCDVAVCGHDLVDELLREGAHGHAVGSLAVGGTPLREVVLAGLVGHVGAGKLPRMRELERGHGPVAANGVSRVSCAGKRVED